MKENQKGNTLVVIILIILAILAGGYSAYLFYASQSEQVPVVEKLSPNNASATKGGESKTSSNTNSNNPSFAKYQAEKTEYSPKLSNYTLALSDLSNLSAFEKSAAFSTPQKGDLLKNNFFIVNIYSDHL